MGYTHYWTYPALGILAQSWHTAIEDCDLVVEYARASLELDQQGNDKEFLWFNGIEDDSDEEFSVPRKITGIRDYIDERTADWPKDPDYWRRDWCKTGGTRPKPYDCVVVACLCVLAETGLEVDSDAGKDGWEEGRALAERALERPIRMPQKLREAA